MKNYGRRLKILLQHQVIAKTIMMEKVKLNSDDDLLLEKTLELHNIIIVIGSFSMKTTNTIHKLP